MYIKVKNKFKKENTFPDRPGLILITQALNRQLSDTDRSASSVLAQYHSAPGSLLHGTKTGLFDLPSPGKFLGNAHGLQFQPFL